MKLRIHNRGLHFQRCGLQSGFKLQLVCIVQTPLLYCKIDLSLVQLVLHCFVHAPLVRAFFNTAFLHRADGLMEAVATWGGGGGGLFGMIEAPNFFLKSHSRTCYIPAMRYGGH